MELDVSSDEISADDLSDQIQSSFRNQIQDHLVFDGISVSDFFHNRDIEKPYTQQCKFSPSLDLNNEPYITIVVATRDRLGHLKKCLKSILDLDYHNFDVVIVDNAPSTNDIRDFIHSTYAQNSKLHYVREDTPGLAIAHNRAFAEVTAPIVAFTDDDVVVDPHWLRAIVHHFLQDDEIGCVTGLILPAELETISQLWVEQFGGFGKGFTKNIFDLGEHRPKDFLFPYTAGKLGSGANMAFRTTALHDIGGFNPALGAGTLSMGGDDLAAFFDIIAHGFKLVYEPAALVFHTHPKAYSNLKQQSYGYGVGLGAFLMRTFMDKPARLGELILKSPFGLIHFLRPKSPQKVNKSYKVPRELRLRQFVGLLYGPVAYLRSFIHTGRMREKLYRFQKSWILDSKASNLK